MNSILTELTSCSQVRKGDYLPNYITDGDHYTGTVIQAEPTYFRVSSGPNSHKISDSQINDVLIFRKSESRVELLAGENVHALLQEQSQPKCTLTSEEREYLKKIKRTIPPGQASPL